MRLPIKDTTTVEEVMSRLECPINNDHGVTLTDHGSYQIADRSTPNLPASDNAVACRSNEIAGGSVSCDFSLECKIIRNSIMQAVKHVLMQEVELGMKVAQYSH